jgi:hypothetical protein
MKTSQVCAAVSTASHQHGLEAGTVCDGSGSVLQINKALPNLPTLNCLVNNF